MTEKATIDELNKLLKGEISACETYEQALGKVKDPAVSDVLKKNHDCHAGRVSTLKSAVSALGGEAAEGSGVWGAVAKLMEGGATVFGDKAAVDVLEEGEDKGLSDYRELMSKVVTSSTIEDLLSKQEQSHNAMRNLKQALASK